MKEITKALLKAQGEFDIIEKDSKNPHFKNDYASLPTILSVVLPVLRNNNILYTSSTYQAEGKFYTKIRLIHTESAESLESDLPILNTADAQKMGGCITYNQRYGLLPLLGIAADMDDDGNTASGLNEKKSKSIPKIDIQSKKDEIKKIMDSHKFEQLVIDWVELNIENADSVALDNIIVRLRTKINEDSKSKTK